MNAVTPLEKIVIVGGGTAGWMAVSLMQAAWPQAAISLVESEDIGVIGVGEGSTPYLRNFFRQLNIPESEWMPACHATFKCGIHFPNWSSKQGFEAYFHPFFSQLDLKTGNAFMQNACIRRRGGDVPAHPDDFWVSRYLAAQNKSPIPSVPLSFEPDYGYHFDSGLLGQFLKARALALGVSHQVATIDRVIQCNNGAIESIVTTIGDIIAGDFFVDCTGFAGLLVNKTLQVPFESYRDYLGNDRAVAIAGKIDGDKPLPSHTESEALSCGWAWKIPLAQRYGNGYVYDSKYLSETEAETELRDHIGPSCEGMPARHLKLRVGRIEQHWCKNVLAVGLSQGFIEPLEATALMLIQYTLDRFIYSYERLLAGGDVAQTRDNFNDKVNANFDGIKDYIVAHYRLNSRTDSDYWIDNRNNKNISPRLQNILDAWDQGLDFEATLTQFKGELSYLRPSWYCLLAGMGRFPEKLQAVTPDEPVAALDDVRNYCEAMANKFPSHRKYLQVIYAEHTERVSVTN